MNAADLSKQALTAALHRPQAGREIHAAVEVITGTSWLEHPGFLATVKVTMVAGCVPYALVNWSQARRLVEVTPEGITEADAALLRLAVHLAGVDPYPDLHWALGPILGALDTHEVQDAAITAVAWLATRSRA